MKLLVILRTRGVTADSLLAFWQVCVCVCVCKRAHSVMSTGSKARLKPAGARGHWLMLLVPRFLHLRSGVIRAPALDGFEGLTELSGAHT